jgi:hypothetical protein
MKIFAAHSEPVPNSDLLASLPKEALEALARSYDEVLARYAKPVLDASQDGPQNQIESKPAVIAESQSLQVTAGSVLPSL